MTPGEGDTLSILGDVLFLANWNTRVVVLGVAALGAAGGVVGSFMLLRRRALLGDALSHATLPGIVLGFLVASALGFDGKSMWVLLTGALVSGLLGMLVIQLIARGGRLSEDAALGIVLSTFFGAGVALLGIAQQDNASSAAGLESFIYGKTASMLARDAMLIGAVGLLCMITCLLLFKELRLTCFDAPFARGQGMPTGLLDLVLMGMVVAVVIIGLQAVGLILVIAILVIPPAAARFWTDRTGRMIVIAGVLGAACAWIGAACSALLPRLPSGAMVVLVLACAFLASLVLGPRRGLLQRYASLRSERARIEREHALRAAWECMETGTEEHCSMQALARRRGWDLRHATAAIERLARRDLARSRTTPEGVLVLLTPSGRREAIEVVRRHRLWEHYLIRRADFDTGHVDRGADELEHLMPAEMLRELEQDLEEHGTTLPGSPHHLAGDDGKDG